MKITYWSDFACPYCYIGEERLLKAIKRLGMENDIELEMKSYELDPNAPKECTGTMAERYAKNMKLGPKGAEYHVERVSRFGRMEGLDMDYAKSKYTNTLDAHRLLKFAQSKDDKEIISKLTKSLFDAYFAKGLELSDRNTLVKICVEAGLSENDIVNALDSDTFTDEVRADESEVEADPDFYGIPLFVIGDKKLEGAAEENALITAIREALAGDAVAENNSEEKVHSDDSDKSGCSDESNENGCVNGVCRI